MNESEIEKGDAINT